MGILQGLEKSLAKNPRQILNLLASGDTNMEQILGFIQNMTNGTTHKAMKLNSEILVELPRKWEQMIELYLN